MCTLWEAGPRSQRLTATLSLPRAGHGQEDGRGRPVRRLRSRHVVCSRPYQREDGAGEESEWLGGTRQRREDGDGDGDDEGWPDVNES